MKLETLDFFAVTGWATMAPAGALFSRESAASDSSDFTGEETGRVRLVAFSSLAAAPPCPCPERCTFAGCDGTCGRPRPAA